MDEISSALNSEQQIAFVQKIAWGSLIADLNKPTYGCFKIYEENSARPCSISEDVLHLAVAAIKQKIHEHEALFGYCIYIGQEEGRICIFAEKTELLARIFLCT